MNGIESTAWFIIKKGEKYQGTTHMSDERNDWKNNHWITVTCTCSSCD